MSEYLDFEISVTSPDYATLKIGHRDYSGKPDLDENTLLQLRAARSGDPQMYGTFLFNALFRMGDDLYAGYRDGLAIARHTEKRLRFRLNIAPSLKAIQELDWETLYDSKEMFFLSRSQETAFSRYVGTSLELPEVPTILPRLLIVISSPKDLSAYNLTDIDRNTIRTLIESSLQPLNGLVQYEFLDAPATPLRIRERLQDGFHALHIQAHGQLLANKDVAELVLENEDHESEFVGEKKLADIFEGIRHLRLVTLVACYGGGQTQDIFGGLSQAIIGSGCPAVIAMRRAISFEAAQRFTRHFYPNLARLGRIDAAINEARNSIYLSSMESSEWSVPALFMRLPDAKLWDHVIPAQEIYRPQQDPSILKLSLKWFGLGEAVPILGPEMYQGLLPSNTKIAEHLLEKYNHHLNDKADLPRVAQYVETMEGLLVPHDDLINYLKEELLTRFRNRERVEKCKLAELVEKRAEHYFDYDPEEPHRILAGLKVSTYITTNYDNLMTSALRWAGKHPQRTRCLWQAHDKPSEEYFHLKGTVEKPVVFHMYGYDDPSSMVLTEDDYLDFLRIVSQDKTRIPLAINETLVNSMLLFLGFNLSDLDWKILFRSLVAPLREMKRNRIAVLQLDPTVNNSQQFEDLRIFMERYSSNLKIKVYWARLRDFLTELRDKI